MAEFHPSKNDSYPSMFPMNRLFISFLSAALCFINCSDSGFANSTVNGKGLLTIRQVNLPNNPSVTTTDVVTKPTGDRPKSSLALAAADQELKSWLQAIPRDARESVAASIDSILQDKKEIGKVIAVGQVELPDDTKTFESGGPAGGILMFQGKKLDVRFGRRSGIYYGTSYRYSRSNEMSHWPWFVTTLEPGKTAQLRSVTLQHKPVTTRIQDSKGRHSVVLPPVKFRPATSRDMLTVKASVTDGRQPLPASGLIGLPGFTDPETLLLFDSPSGSIELSFPREAFEVQDKFKIYFMNAFYRSENREVRKINFSKGTAKLTNVVLKPRQSNMVNAVFTSTGTLANGNRIHLHFDSTNPKLGSRHAYQTVSPKQSIRISKYSNSTKLSFGSMTHYVDLGKAFPANTLKKPVDSWLDINDLLPGTSLTPEIGHTYLLKCREPENATEMRWGLVRLEPPTNAFDNYLSNQRSLGRGFEKLAHRLGRFPQLGITFGGSSLAPSIRLSGLDDNDVKLLTKIPQSVYVRLDNSSKLSIKGMKQLGRTRCVAGIDFMNCNPTAAELSALSSFQGSLRFNGCYLRSKLRTLVLQSVNSVSLRNCRLDGRFIAALSGCSSLTSLSLEDCSGLQGQEASFQYLPRSLSSLQIRNCEVSEQLKEALRQQRGWGLNVNIYEN